jgi:hypothetical protein
MGTGNSCHRGHGPIGVAIAAVRFEAGKPVEPRNGN